MHISFGSRRALAAFSTLLLALFAGCLADKKGGDFAVVATTGHINDALRTITEGTPIELTSLCGPGVDPHSYSASTADVQAMEAASLIVYNGFHLEAQLDTLLKGNFKDRAWSMASAFPQQDRIDWVEDGEVDPAAPYDPHIWNNLPGWAACVEGLTERLCQANAAHAEQYRANGAAYAAKIRAAHEDAKAKLAEIPEARRFLVSGHDAFNYFARAYGLDTVAVLGVGNDQEADIKAISEVAETIASRKVPVIFMESLTNPKITQALKEATAGRGWKVEIASERLYSDDLGDAAPQDTYLGAFRSNVAVILAALR